MGYAIVPDIKDEKVVCQSLCRHRDCAANRKEWGGAVCVTCGHPLTPGQAFYYADGATPDHPKHEHAGCAYDRVEGVLKSRLKEGG